MRQNLKSQNNFLQLSKKKQKGREGLLPGGRETEVYLLSYLAISDRVHYKYFLIAFYRKRVIIGSSAFHNYDSYTVEMTKAASAKRSAHRAHARVLR